jgi:hypothetical protein
VDILWELEEASKTPFAEKHERPSGLWVEHVLPQTWTEEWPFAEAEYAGPYSDVPRAVARRSIVDTLGSLTLTTSGLNISAGNDSFATKQAKYAKHTGPFLNKWFGEHEAWGEAQIRERGERLFALAVKIWRGLDAF